jgi:hypothetical protein
MAQLAKNFVIATLAAAAWSVVIRSINWSVDPSLELRLECGVGDRLIKARESSCGGIVEVNGITGNPRASTGRASVSLERAASGSVGRGLL